MRLSRGAEDGFHESLRHQRLSERLSDMEEELRELMYDLKRFKRMDKGMDYFSETIEEITDTSSAGGTKTKTWTSSSLTSSGAVTLTR